MRFPPGLFLVVLILVLAPSAWGQTTVEIIDYHDPWFNGTTATYSIRPGAPSEVAGDGLGSSTSVEGMEGGFRFSRSAPATPDLVTIRYHVQVPYAPEEFEIHFHQRIEAGAPPPAGDPGSLRMSVGVAPGPYRHYWESGVDEYDARFELPQYEAGRQPFDIVWELEAGHATNGLEHQEFRGEVSQVEFRMVGEPIPRTRPVYEDVREASSPSGYGLPFTVPVVVPQHVLDGNGSVRFKFDRQVTPTGVTVGSDEVPLNRLQRSREHIEIPAEYLTHREVEFHAFAPADGPRHLALAPFAVLSVLAPYALGGLALNAAEGYRSASWGVFRRGAERIRLAVVVGLALVVAAAPLIFIAWFRMARWPIDGIGLAGYVGTLGFAAGFGAAWSWVSRSLKRKLEQEMYERGRFAETLRGRNE